QRAVNFRRRTNSQVNSSYRENTHVQKSDLGTTMPAQDTAQEELSPGNVAFAQSDAEGSEDAVLSNVGVPDIGEADAVLSNVGVPDVGVSDAEESEGLRGGSDVGAASDVGAEQSSLPGSPREVPHDSLAATGRATSEPGVFSVNEASHGGADTPTHLHEGDSEISSEEEDDMDHDDPEKFHIGPARLQSPASRGGGASPHQEGLLRKTRGDENVPAPAFAESLTDESLSERGKLPGESQKDTDSESDQLRFGESDTEGREVQMSNGDSEGGDRPAKPKEDNLVPQDLKKIGQAEEKETTTKDDGADRGEETQVAVKHEKRAASRSDKNEKPDTTSADGTGEVQEN
ncbi:unnamed protein product, partial [Amoebophrya sp. A25]